MLQSNIINYLFYISILLYIYILIYIADYREAIFSIFIEMYSLIDKVLTTDIINDDNLTRNLLFMDILKVSPNILMCLSVLSILILIDRVIAERMFYCIYSTRRLNCINTSQYPNYISLIFNETLNYLLSTSHDDFVKICNNH